MVVETSDQTADRLPRGSSPNKSVTGRSPTVAAWPEYVEGQTSSTETGAVTEEPLVGPAAEIPGVEILCNRDRVVGL